MAAEGEAPEKYSEVWVPVDAAGPIGAFVSEAQAQAVMGAYKSIRWRGAIFCHRLAEPLPAGEDVCYLMPPDSPVPFFVAGIPEALKLHAELEPTGLVEPNYDLRCRRSMLGKMIPAAKKRLEPLLGHGGERGDAAMNIMLDMMKPEGTGLDDEDVEEPFPVVGFVISSPKPFLSQVDDCATSEVEDEEPAAAVEPPGSE